MMDSRVLSFFLLLLPTISVARYSLSGDPNNICVYSFYVRTSSIWKGGTDSIVGVNINDTSGNSISIPNLEAWGGLMGPDHDYYERGVLDMFSGRGPCLSGPPCAMDLYTDGYGRHHGWYCNYVEVTATGPHVPCQQQLFTVEQWLASDAPPWQIRTSRNNCANIGTTSNKSGGHVSM